MAEGWLFTLFPFSPSNPSHIRDLPNPQPYLLLCLYTNLLYYIYKYIHPCVRKKKDRMNNAIFNSCVAARVPRRGGLKPNAEREMERRGLGILCSLFGDVQALCLTEFRTAMRRWKCLHGEGMEVIARNR